MLPLLALLAASCVAQSVTLPAGILQGGTCASLGDASYAGSNASYFYSIPYAQPPVGQLRFAPPQAYNGTLGRATVPAPACPQLGQEFVEPNQSEDCLYLDVWVPANAKAGDNLPVKVWIYGGGNFAGSISNPTYNGCNLAATGAVVVSINYRLGALGFLGLSSFGIGGNFGTQDQLLGLSWVQTNIRAFGGDPTKVMIFGQSAGAVDTYTLGSLPQAPSLFKGGIAQSGGGRALPQASSANAFGALWAQTIGCSDITCLRSKTLAQLNITLSTVPNPNPGPSYNPNNVRSFGPFVDGKVIPVNPADAGMRVPFIFGSTSREDSLLLLSQPGVTSPADFTPAVYAAYLNSTFGSAASIVNNRYPVSAFSSAAFPAFEALVEVATQTGFLCPSYQGLMRANQVGTPVWTYLWSQAPTCPWYNSFNASVLPIFGAAHTAEIPYVFGNTYNNPPPVGNCNFTQAEDSLSREFIGFWTGMTSGNPGSLWPQFFTNTSMGLNVLNGSSIATTSVVDYSICSFWNQVNATIFGNASSSSNSTGSGGSGTSNSTGTSSTSSSGSGSSGSATSTRPAIATFTGAATSIVARNSFIVIGIATILGAYIS